MANVEFFKQQAKNLMKDYNTRTFIGENEFFNYEYTPKYFSDIYTIVRCYGIKEDGSFTLMNAQHVVALLAGFSKWNELIKASEPLLEIGKLLLTHRDSYEVKVGLEDSCKRVCRYHKNRSGDDKISIVENWKLYEKSKLQDADDYTKLEVFKKKFLELDSPNKIKTQKFTIDFRDNINAQDMLMTIIKKTNLSPEEAILWSINSINSVKILSKRWASIAADNWGHNNPHGKKETLEKPLIEVSLNKYQISLLEVVMKNEKVSLEVAVQCFMIFTLESLGYHI